MAERWYALAEWDETTASEVDSHGREAGWYPPQGTVGLFDMRPSSAAALGFFALDHQPVNDDWLGVETPEVHVLNDGTDLRDFEVDGSDKSRWRSLLGLSSDEMPDNKIATLEDMLVWTFERCGDPEYQQRFKPPTATAAGYIEFHLGGHSLLSRRGFTDLPQSAQDRTLDLVQKDMSDLVELCQTDRAPQDLHRRWAWNLCGKYGMSRGSASGTRGWHRLYPKRMRGNVDPPMEPHTTVSDNFDRANEALDAGNWTEVDGDWGVRSNEAELLADGSTQSKARYETDLSTDDHYGRADVTALPSQYTHASPAVRFDAGANTYYGSTLHYDGPSTQYLRAFKFENGSRTNLDSDQSVSTSLPDTVKTQLDGSTFTSYFNGTQLHNFTDTSITGNLRGGIHASGDPGISLDNFEAADLGGGGVSFQPAWARGSNQVINGG